MGLLFEKTGKNSKAASCGIHHYSIDGDYYHGWEIFYAVGVSPPPCGKAWVKIGEGNSLGKCEGPARQHLKAVSEPSQ